MTDSKGSPLCRGPRVILGAGVHGRRCLHQRTTLEVTVDTDMDTFATAPYVRIDDELATDPTLGSGGPRCVILKLSDAELLISALSLQPPMNDLTGHRSK